jgi:hypothetical protein
MRDFRIYVDVGFQPWRWRQYIPPKRYLPTSRHDVTTPSPISTSSPPWEPQISHIQNLWFSLSIVEKSNQEGYLSCRGHATHMGERRNACHILIENLERKRPHRRPETFCMNLREMGCKDVNWILLAQIRLQWQGLWHGDDFVSIET